MNIRKQRRKAWKRFLNQCKRNRPISGSKASTRQRELAGQWFDITHNIKPGTYERTSERQLRRNLQRAG